MVVNKVAENVLATIGTTCWAVQVIPQIWKSYCSKSTDGLSEWLVLVWGISGPFLGVYVVVQNLDTPLILQPHILSFLLAISWTQCLFYGRKWPLMRCIICGAALIALMAGFEAAMIYAVRAPARNGNTTPLKCLSIANSVIAALAFLPQYWEIYKRKEVVGLSIAFMGVEICGGLFLILSLAFKERFDVFASVSYGVGVATDVIIVIAALFLNPTARRKRAAQTFEPERAAEAPEMLAFDTMSSNSPVSQSWPEKWMKFAAVAKA